MLTVKVGGVPEHFNLAWHLAIENGSFRKQGINLEWSDIPGGTGAMCNALRHHELDIAIGLTEGMIADINKGNPSRIVQFYVNSPLKWGIYVHSQSSIQSMNQLHDARYAISRKGSGSHLMARVNATQCGLCINDEQLVVVGDLEGARKAMAEDHNLVFLWEKYTTKPLVDSGEFRKIGTCETPWPCFVIVVSNDFINNHPNELITILNTINLSCLLLKNNRKAPELIASRYKILPEDAAAWFRELEYACHPDITDQEMNPILSNLLRYNLIDNIPPLSDICNAQNLIYTAIQY